MSRDYETIYVISLKIKNMKLYVSYDDTSCNTWKLFWLVFIYLIVKGEMLFKYTHKLNTMDINKNSWWK